MAEWPCCHDPLRFSPCRFDSSLPTHMLPATHACLRVLKSQTPRHMLRPSEEGPRYQNAKGARLALLVMFLDTLLFDWPCKNGRTCVEFCGEVATRTALLLHTHSMRCVARLLKGCAQNSNVHLRSCDFALFGRKIKINRGARRTHI